MSAHCPNCSHALSQTEQQDGWCEQCGKRIPTSLTARLPGRTTSVTPLAPLGPSVYRPGGADVLAWGTVRAGLALVFAGLLLLVAGLAIVTLYVVASTAPKGNSRSSGAEFVPVMLAVYAVIVGWVLFLAGQCMGSAVPAESGARGWAVGNLVVIVLQVLLQLVTLLPSERLLTGTSPLGMLVVQLVLVELGMVFFLLFLSQVASVFGNRRAATFAKVYLVVSLLLWLPTILFVLMTDERRLALAAQEQEAILLGLAGSGILMGVWLAVLVGSARGAITRALGD